LTQITGAAQHEAWLKREIPPVEQLAPDLWSVPIPMPAGNPLRYVSVYVIAAGSQLLLVDAGWDSDESWAALSAGLSAIGATTADVVGCLVTHQHFDHIGLAGRVREASGAWIGLHPADCETMMRPDFREPAVALPAELQWLVQLGAAEEEARRIVYRPERFDPRSTLPIPDRLIEDGELIALGTTSLRAVHTPGHTVGHLCFVEEQRKLLFAGDHVLPRISPNISADRDREVDALGNFLRSLGRISQEDVDEVLPAHEWRFTGLGKRTSALRAHHEARLEETLAVIRASPGCVPWQIAAELTWSRPWDQYDGAIRVSAVGETAAHVVHLLQRGLVTATSEAVPRYHLRG
jgi:glyoxylase-like metal-dependent hydrolase (beta-lactamase superfamily II)